ncbi:MAG: hypothetical protein ACRDSR_07450 [Pseudonocardiaceae bacterium]
MPAAGELLNELFPGLTEQLVRAGAVTTDTLGGCRIHVSGQRLRQIDIGLPLLGASRPFLEGHVRQRVRALPSVRFVEGCDAVGLVTDIERRRVTGVRVAHRDKGAMVQTVTADLVVDATGRGLRTPVWLEQLGYPRPEVDRVEIRLGYSSRHYRLRPGALGADMAIFTAPTPGNHRGVALAPLEGGRHIVTLVGILGDHPPTDRPDSLRSQPTPAFPTSQRHSSTPTRWMSRCPPGSRPMCATATSGCAASRPVYW